MSGTSEDGQDNAKKLVRLARAAWLKRNSAFLPFLLTFPFVVVVGLLVLALLSDERNQRAIQLLTILLAWPPVVGLVALAAGVRFQRGIAAYIDRLISLKVGSVEVRAEDQIAKTLASGKGPPPPEQTESVAEAEAGVAHGPASLEAKLAAAQVEAVSWRYEYLATYLVARTQAVLLWFSAQTEPISRSIFVTIFLGRMPNEAELEAVLQALRRSGLITDNDLALAITPAGFAFIGHMDKYHPGWRFRATEALDVSGMPRGGPAVPDTLLTGVIDGAHGGVVSVVVGGAAAITIAGGMVAEDGSYQVVVNVVSGPAQLLLRGQPLPGALFGLIAGVPAVCNARIGG